MVAGLPIVYRSNVGLWTWVQCGTLNSIFFDQRFKLDPWTWTWSYWPVQQYVLSFGKLFNFPLQKVNMLGPQRAYRPESPWQGFLSSKPSIELSPILKWPTIGNLASPRCKNNFQLQITNYKLKNMIESKIRLSSYDPQKKLHLKSRKSSNSTK